MRKKIRLTVLITMIAMLGAACNSEKNNIESTVKLGNQPSFCGSEDGYFYLIDTEEGDRRLQYYDQKTNEEIVVCEQLNCDHTTTSCQAWFGRQYKSGNRMAKEIVVKGNKIYSIGSEKYWLEGSNESPNYLYCMDLNGKNREKLAYLNDGQLENYRLCVTDNYAYYNVVEGDWTSESYIIKLCRVGLDKSSEPEVILECKDLGYGYAFGDCLVVSATTSAEDMTKSDIFVFEDSNSEPTVTIKDLTRCVSGLWLEGDYLYGAWNEKMHRYNIETGEDTILMEKFSSMDDIAAAHPEIVQYEMHAGNNGLAIFKVGKDFYVQNCMQADLVEFFTPGLGPEIVPKLWKLDEDGNITDSWELDEDCLDIVYADEEYFVQYIVNISSGQEEFVRTKWDVKN